MWFIMVMLPAYVTQLGGSEADVGLVLSAFAATALLARPLVGRMADQFGRKTVALAGCLIGATAPLLYILTSSVGLLFPVRMYHGLSIALFSTAATVWVADIVPASRRAEAMGLFSNASQVAIALAPLLGAIVYGRGGFPLLFAAAAGAGACSLLLSGAAKETPRSGGTGLAPASFTEALTRRDVLAMTFALAATAATWGVLIAFLPLFVMQRHSGQSALFFTIYAISTIVLRLIVGPMSDRLGRRVVVAPALVLLAGVMFLFPMVNSTLALYLLAIPYSLSFGTLYPTLSAFLVDVAPPHVRGSAIGVLTAGFDLGIVIGSTLGGLLAQWANIETTFVACGLFCLVGVAVFWRGTREAKTG